MIIKKKKEVKRKRQIYYDESNVGAFGGVQRFKEELRSTTGDVKNWLRTQPTYSLHKPVRKKFPTRKYYTSGLNMLWQMDLMEMIPYARINKGYKYILTCIDVFSRFARAQPLKSKNGIDVSTAIAKMLKDTLPHSIQTDLGREFYNKHVQGLFKKNGNIKHYTVNSQFKAALVERFNRTLREKFNRLFTYKGNKIWYSHLSQVIETYNKSKHRGIFYMKPIDITMENEYELWKLQQPTHYLTLKSHIPLLNYVRISRIANGPFNKNFDQNWSEEVFRIIGTDTKSQPHMYILEDLKHVVISGKFYREELQDIGGEMPQQYRIEKVLQSKGKGEHKQYLVKWHGYDASYNSWINAKNVEK